MIDYDRLALEIYSLIIRYVRLGKNLDLDFIKEFKDYVISALGLKDYLTQINCPRIYSHQLAEYQYRNRETTIDLFKVQNFAKNITKYVKANDPKLVTYVQTSKILLHEAMHAMQYKQVASKSKELEPKILQASLIYDFISQNPEMYAKYLEEGYSPKLLQAKYQLYIDNYDLAPEERLAEEMAYSIVIQVLTLMGDNAQNLTLYYLIKLLQSSLRGYDKTLNPSKRYLEILETSKLLTKDELEGKNLPFEKRLKLGLEITEEERDNLYARRLELTHKLQK